MFPINCRLDPPDEVGINSLRSATSPGLPPAITPDADKAVIDAGNGVDCESTWRWTNRW